MNIRIHSNRKKSWLARRSRFQIYLLCLTALTVTFIGTGLLDYQMPDLARLLLPEGYRDFLHTGTYSGKFSPGLLLYIIGVAWFPLTPLLYGAARRYRAWKRQQSYVYGGEYVTMKGEMVKSYGEKKIADYLYSNGIRYEYERPFYGYDEYGRYRLLAHPDFFIPDYETVIEYFGMTGSSESYDSTARWKMERYRQNGIHAIAVFPRDLDNPVRVL